MDLNNKVCVITGAASGIGASCARAFSSQGAKVVVVDLNESGAQEVAAEIDGLALGCNVAREEDVQNAVRQAETRFGSIDLFFSNAGIANGGGPIDSTDEDWQSEWDVNVMAHVYAIRAVLPKMLERGDGYLVHTASMAGILTTHGNVVYAATKHAVVGLAEWLSITYHNRGVRTSLLAPLGVNTPMLGSRPSQTSRSAVGPIKEPEEVADMVVEAIQEERFLVLTDPIAQVWMDRKSGDLERWLNGMRRMQGKLDDAKAKNIDL